MKKLILNLFITILLSSYVRAEEYQNQMENLVRWVADQKINAGSVLTLGGSLKAAVYLDLLSYGEKGLSTGTGLPYVDFAGGLALSPDDKPEPLILFMFHIYNISSKLITTFPSRDRFSLRPLPDIQFGPFLKLPVPNKSWVFNNSLGIAASFRF